MKDLTTQLTNTQGFRSYTEKLEEQFTQVNEMLKKVTTLLEQEKYKSEQLDKGWNKTIDAHEVTKQRLLGYENEAGVPKSASERKIYLQGGEDYITHTCLNEESRRGTQNGCQHCDKTPLGYPYNVTGV